MKKVLSLLLITAAVASCQQASETTTSVDAVIEDGNLDSIKTKRDALLAEYDDISKNLDKLDQAIEDLDTAKKYPLITSYTVQEDIFKHYIDIQGDVATRQNVVIRPEVQAGLLTNVYVKEGDRVSKGQLLAKIDDGGLSQQLAQAEAQASLAKTTFERQERLWKQKIGSEIQYLQAKTNYEATQKQAEQLRIEVAKRSIKAPFAGIVDDIMAEVGELLSMQSQLIRIVNLSNMYVEASVPETYVGKVLNGTEAKIEVPTLGLMEESKVRQAGNFINPANRTFSIEVPVSNEQKLMKPNLIVNLKLNDYTHEGALIIPDDVIQENAKAEKFVFVLKNLHDGHANLEKVEIKTGYSYNNMIEVLEGLSKGDMIVKEGAKSMREGLTVKVKS